MQDVLSPVSSVRFSNLVKTTVLLAAMTALALGVGQLIGGPRGILFAGAIVAVMNFVSFWFSDRLALAMNRAHPLRPGALPWLEDLTAQLARRADVPMPRLYLIDSPTPNAFATGRSPSKAAVAVTTGLLELLNRRELAGVIAHELAHVKNRDTLLMTVAGTLAGVITHVVQTLFWFGGVFSGRHSEDDDGPGPLATLGLLIVAPLAATLLQLAVSRAREFDADASAAQYTGDPDGLASALSRLESGNRMIPNDHSPATAHLFIVNPLSGRGVMGLFSTHPPIEERVRRLVSLR
jgi:heat shock protein HtpX